MMCFRDRTFCNAACSCRDCGVRLTDAVRRAADAGWAGQRGPAPMSIAARSNGCPDFVPAGRQ